MLITGTSNGSRRMDRRNSILGALPPSRRKMSTRNLELPNFSSILKSNQDKSGDQDSTRVKDPMNIDGLKNHLAHSTGFDGSLRNN